MATTIRHVTLKPLGKNRDIDPMKGTVVNSFTQQEYDSLCHTSEWLGGYVEAMGYVAPPMMDGMGDGSSSGSFYGNYKTYHFDYNAGYNYFNIYRNNNFVAYNANSATL